MGFIGVYIILLISARKHRLWVLVRTISVLENIDCGYSLEPPHRGGSNEYPQSMFSSRNMKTIRVVYLRFFQLFEIKFSIYLNRRVFIMGSNIVHSANTKSNAPTKRNRKQSLQPLKMTAVLASEQESSDRKTKQESKWAAVLRMTTLLERKQDLTCSVVPQNQKKKKKERTTQAPPPSPP